MITTRMICQLAPMNFWRFHNWISLGIVPPIKKGRKGRGNSHQFSLMQAIGLVIAIRLRDSRRGASAAYTGDVVRGFSLITEENLQALFLTGRTHFSESFDLKGVALLDLKETGERHGRVDVKEVYEAILKEMRVAK